MLESPEDLKNDAPKAREGELTMKKGAGRNLKSLLLFGVSALAASTPGLLTKAVAQETAAEAAASEEEDIVVVGTQIRGARVNDVLPVTVLGEDDIAAASPTNGDDLFRSIPQAGDVTFNEARLTGGINDARGDTASINLRGLGTGNTLMLINGRRMVLHPAIQVENLVPVATVNTNTIPVFGVRRVEVLRDGASAIYGTDAVAGVINTVLRDNYEGFRVTMEGAQTADSRMSELDLGVEAGIDFNGGRGNISFFGALTHRDPLFAAEREFSRSADTRSLVDDPAFLAPTETAALDAFRNTSLDTPWAEFRRVVTGGTYALSTTSLSANGTTITSTSSGAATFHVQPNSNPGCLGGASTVAPGVCFDNSILTSATEDENLRYNSNDIRTLFGEVDRVNLFTFLNHDFGNVELFAEAGYFSSEFLSQREQETNLATQRLIVPATNFWNPFGPTILNAAPNPNQLAVTNAPAGGVSFELQDYRVVDGGPLTVDVEQWVGRALTGVRGDVAGWDWESAFLYSRANTIDTMRQPSMTLFQAALSRSTNTAYNPFTGGNPNDPANGDSSPNPQAVLDTFMVDVTRESHTSMAMWDFRVSRPDLFNIWGGNSIGIAAGVELRRETYGDDRDPRLDGTITFTPLDNIVGLAPLSDVMGASPTPDTSGARNVQAAFLEFAVPLVSPEMNIPFINSLEMQIAGRYENYTSFGDVMKPKVGLAWRPFEWLMFRSAWSEGFRAPNLPQQFERGILRSNTRSDWIRCEARQQAGTLPAFSGCGGVESVSVQSNRSGSILLEPETSENFTAGLVFQTTFLPSSWGEFTLTADYWSVEQDQIIGLLGDANAITLDYLLRMRGDTNGTNPGDEGNVNVLRSAPDAGDVTLFTGALDNNGNPLTPIGEVIQVIDNYRNLGPRETEGFDIGVYYEVDETPIGDFDVRLNFARLLTFFQSPGPEQADLLAAQAAGEIDPFPNVPGAESLIEQDGSPKWRSSATVTWRAGPVGVGYFTSYVSGVDDTGARLSTGQPWRIDSWQTHNLYLQYTIEGAQLLDEVRIRLGARNITNEMPPLADTDTGFLGDLHSPRGRVVYLSLRSEF